MDTDEVRSLARGRIWSGQDAFEHGLVDGLGGLSDAITTAKELANLPQVSQLTVHGESDLLQCMKVCCQGEVTVHTHTLPCSMRMQM